MHVHREHSEMLPRVYTNIIPDPQRKTQLAIELHNYAILQLQHHLILTLGQVHN